MNTLARSTALGKSLLVSDKPSVLHSVIVHNTGPDQFLFIYDLKTTTVSGTPIAIIPLAEDKTVAFDSLLCGVPFDHGILLANSTTNATFTAGADDCWFTATHG